MYEKNLTEDLRLRLSAQDMDFLRKLSSERGSSVSECIRSIIGEYRRSLDTLATLRDALNMAKAQSEKQGVIAVQGDTDSGHGGESST